MVVSRIRTLWSRHSVRSRWSIVLVGATAGARLKLPRDAWDELREQSKDGEAARALLQIVRAMRSGTAALVVHVSEGRVVAVTASRVKTVHAMVLDGS